MANLEPEDELTPLEKIENQISFSNLLLSRILDVMMAQLEHVAPEQQEALEILHAKGFFISPPPAIDEDDPYKEWRDGRGDGWQ